MRLGGPVFLKNLDPESWVNALKIEGYRAAVCPISHEVDNHIIKQYRDIAKKNDIVIAEVGAWSNPISPNAIVRKEALDFCKKQLELAEKVGAICCVNIAGSRGKQWDGPHELNFSDETFEMIVDSVREIIDDVNPRHAFYGLETMPWIYPDTTDSYLALIKAIDRKQFGVHLDPVNMISNPKTYYSNGAMMKDFFTKLGPYIKTCHAKDISLSGQLTVNLEEVIPGKGTLDYDTYLTELNTLNPDIPLIIEHLSTQEEYQQAAQHIRSCAEKLKINF